MTKPLPLRPRSHRSARVTSSRWAAYATAGAATALACVPKAEADIHYMPVNQALDGAGHTNNIDFRRFQLAPGVIMDFLQIHNSTANRGLAGFYFETDGAFSAQFIGVAGTYGGLAFHYLAKLNFGDNIVAGNFLPNAGRGYRGGSNPFASGPGYPNSQWASVTTGYMAFKFNVGDGVQYGWAQLSMNGPSTNTFTLVDYAFADPGQVITAGQVPEPGSLALLATGAVGLLLWRKRRAS